MSEPTPPAATPAGLARVSPPPVRGVQVAEVVAAEIRRRILDGELRDGDLLPKLEDLVGEFGTSRMTVRDALRILELEGLLVVRRGRLGGAVVRLPEATNSAHSLGIMLRAHDVPLEDVGAAIQLVEPTCVALCAARPDRGEQLVPALWDVQQRTRSARDDPQKFVELSGQFHHLLVNGCGNATLIVVLTALESLWAVHAGAWAESQGHRADSFPDPEYPAHLLKDHETVLRHVSRGAVEPARRAAKAHLEWVSSYVTDRGLPVEPALLTQPR